MAIVAQQSAAASTAAAARMRRAAAPVAGVRPPARATRIGSPAALRPALLVRRNAAVVVAASAPAPERRDMAASAATNKAATAVAAATSALPAERKASSPLREWFARIGKAAAVAAVAVALVLGNVAPAHAARSAGRVGGFAGDSGGGGAAAESRSYGGGSSGYSSGGGGYGGGYSSGGYTRGYGGAYDDGFLSSGPSLYYSRPPVVIAPPPVVVAPVAPLVAAPGVSTTTVVAEPEFDAFDALLLAGLGFVAFSTVTSSLSDNGRAGGFLGAGSDDDDGYYGSGGELQVTKLQVGLLAVARGLKAELDALAESADTATNEGLRALLQEAVLALLRNPEYCAYAAASKRGGLASAAALEREFNAASLAERSKFEAETLVNFGGAALRRGALKPAGAAAAAAQPDELIVVTLLVASRGAVPLPKRVDSVESLRTALRALGALRAEQVLGFELQWTPQAEGDSFSRDDLARDYPDLRML